PALRIKCDRTADRQPEWNAAPSVPGTGCGDKLSSGRTLGKLPQAEIEEFHLAVWSENDIGGLQIAMNDSLVVRRLQRLCNLPANRERFVDGNGTTSDTTSASASPGTSSTTKEFVPFDLQIVDRSSFTWFAPGIIAAGFGGGTASFIPVISYLIRVYTYRDAFLVTGIVQGVVICSLHFQRCCVDSGGICGGAFI